MKNGYKRNEGSRNKGSHLHSSLSIKFCQELTGCCPNLISKTGFGGFGDALYIYRFEIMILLRVKAKSLLCYWAVSDLGIGTVKMR